MKNLSPMDFKIMWARIIHPPCFGDSHRTHTMSQCLACSMIRRKKCLDFAIELQESWGWKTNNFDALKRLQKMMLNE